MQIKQKHILVPGRRYQDSRHLLQNPKVSKNVIGFNNHTQRSTPPYYLDVDNPLEEKQAQPHYSCTLKRRLCLMNPNKVSFRQGNAMFDFYKQKKKYI